MASFSYRAASVDGKLTRGVMEAADESAAVSALKSSGVIILDIGPGAGKAGTKSFPIFRRAKYDLLTFTTELSSLLNAGLPLDKALGVLSGISESKAMRRTVESVLKSVKEGNSFSEALRLHPDVFPRLYVNMIRAGEAGGVLDVVLDNLNQFLEARKELKDHVSSAMIYPSILVATSGVSITFLITYVLPKFNSIFQDMGASLPYSTRLLLSASEGLRAWWWALLAPVFFIWIFFRGYAASKEGRCRLDGFKIRLLGSVVTKIETARFCRTLGTLLASGVPLLPALKNSKEVMTNQVMAASLDEVSREVSEGKGIAQSISKTGVFPQLAVSMIQVGEETGQLSEMLLRVASIYEKFLKNAIRRLISFLEPALILCMGLITGFIVVSMLSAIFSITDISF
ncbi:MAG: type II secretion system F family protein [Nitrospiraceae bacterium]|nr:type II secretion system F family protein [Nitrospiraceae bacterium]